jgi:SAM-dependent methyltransferase
VITSLGKRMLQHTRDVFRKRRRDRQAFLKGLSGAEMPVTPAVVTWGYRLFLGREPESAQVVEEKVKDCATLEELRRVFLTSHEFKQQNQPARTPSLSGHEPRMTIQNAYTDNDLHKLFAHIQGTWHSLGETEPYWSVLTSEKFKQSHIQQALDQFYDSGMSDVRRLFSTLERNNIDYAAFKSCLEYGCGLGRVTRWLSEKFDIVYGYDISLAHLERAESYLNGQHIRNTVLRHIKHINEILNLPKVDLVYSILVLQHNPPPLMSFIIRELIKALNPSGVALFQVPTYRLGYRFSLEEYYDNEAPNHQMEAHCLPQKTIFTIARQEGGQVIEVLDDCHTGVPYEVSNTFLIQKLAFSGQGQVNSAPASMNS